MNSNFRSYYRKRQSKVSEICAIMQAGKKRKRLEENCVREPKMITPNNLSTIFKVLGLTPDTEYRFHPVRKFRFDYAFPDIKVAIEYEGIFSQKSRHTGVTGYINDCTKYNLAVMEGWKVFRVTAKHIQDGEAYKICEWIKEREVMP